MTKPHHVDQAEPFVITEEADAELIAPGWWPGETLSEAVSKCVAKIGTARGCEPRGKGV